MAIRAKGSVQNLIEEGRAREKHGYRKNIRGRAAMQKPGTPEEKLEHFGIIKFASTKAI
jgi:hypothetical protein